MTPKEKAEVLLDDFYCNIDFNECYQGSKTSAKQCALIFVEQMLEECYGYRKGIKYWQEVKQEINKL